MTDTKIIRSDLSPRPSKRRKIREMLSAGYGTQEIAEVADTTPANVWKEKSSLKTSGLLLRRQSRNRLQVSEHKDEIIMIHGDGRRRSSADTYNYNHYYRFLNIRELDEKGLKTLYKDLKDGKEPADILAQHGFHPEVVEKEYQRYLRLNEHSVIGSFQEEVIQSLQCISNSELVRKFNIEGYLSKDQFKELIELRLYQEREVQKKIEARRYGADKRYVNPKQ